MKKTSEVNRLIREASERGEHEFVIPVGTYEFDEPLISPPNMAVRGAGENRREVYFKPSPKPGVGQQERETE